MVDAVTLLPVPVLLSRSVGDEPTSVDARSLHAALGVGRDFSTWFRSRIDELGLVADVDFCAFSRSPDLGNVETSGFRTAIEYAVTLDAAKHLAMAERNDVGRRVRAYFIEAEKRLRASVVVDPLAVLSDPAQLRVLLGSYAERLEAEQGKNAALTATVAEQTPKVEVYDRIVETGDTLGLREAHKVLRDATGITERELVARVIGLGWVQRLGRRLAPASYGEERGYVVARLSEWRDLAGVNHSKPELRFTPKGIARLTKLLLAEAA